MIKPKKHYLIVIIYIVLLAAAVAAVLKLGSSEEETIQKIGFITAGKISDTGWSAVNYKGLKEACDELGTELSVLSGVQEFTGDCPKAVEKLVREGAGMIILNSPGYAEEMKNLLSKYPDIAFYASGSDYETSNLTFYSSRLYQARYLSGIVAGMQTQSNRIGFVAADKKPEVYRGINAFTLGVRRVNPKAEVIVSWTGNWDNAQKERELASALIEQEKVDVITYHQDNPYVIDVAEKYDVASIGYYEPVSGVSDKYLTCAVCDWAPLYNNLIQEYLRGQHKTSRSDWLGLRAGVISLTDYSPLVSQETREIVEEAKEEILTSNRGVFSGKIYDNEGNLRCAADESMSDEYLIYEMDWLVKGVREYAQ